LGGVPIYGNAVTSASRENDCISIKKGKGCRELKHEGAVFNSEGAALLKFSGQSKDSHRLARDTGMVYYMTDIYSTEVLERHKFLEKATHWNLGTQHIH